MKRMKKWLVFGLVTAIVACAVGCSADSQSSSGGAQKEVVVYMPDGAPAMGVASLMAGDLETDGVTYKVVSPTLIASKVSAKDQAANADICALPVTAASKLLGSGEKYRMLGTLTGGNLYILSKDSQTVADFSASGVSDLSHLVGKTVGVMKINEVPGLTFKCILENYGLAWQELKNDGAVADDKVNLKAIVDATAINPLATDIACYVVAEPAASVQVKKNGFVNVASLSGLYDKGEVVEGYSGYPQAVLVAKTSLIEERTAWVAQFMDDVAASGAALSSMSGADIVAAVTAHLEDSSYTTTLKANVLSAETVARCGVHFVESASCKKAVVSYLSRLTEVDSAAAKTVSDAFFYLG